MQNLLMIAAIIFGIFMLGRMLVLWYLRINRIVELLERIAANTARPIAGGIPCTDAETLDRR
jgi:hypothetical protein